MLRNGEVIHLATLASVSVSELVGSTVFYGLSSWVGNEEIVSR